MDYEFGMHLASRSTKRTASIVVSNQEISRDTYEKEVITTPKPKITPKKRASKSIQDIEKGSLLNLKKDLDELQLDENIDENSDEDNNSSDEDDQKNDKKKKKKKISKLTNNNVLDFVKEASKNPEKLSKTFGKSNGTSKAYYSSANNSVMSATSMASVGIFHPNKFVGNSKFAAPKSTVSNAATIDPLDKLNGMDELNHYDKHKELGTGTDAFVYEVVDRRDKSHVAMKLTKRKSGRYRTEIHLLYQLRTCPYIVKLLKVLEDDNVYVLILEQAPMTLEMLLHERCTEIPMQERVSKEIISDVFKGLKSIHNLGFVHKDMKPENVLIFADRLKRKLQAKIADFGFATRCELQNNGDSNKKKIQLSQNQLNEMKERVEDKCGTPGFWAPELVAGCVNLSEAFKMDVFSCGVTLYRMLCNEMPFGLFEKWELKKEENKIKLAKMKPNFQIVSWMRVKKNNSVGKNNKNNKPKYDYIRKSSKQKLSDNALDLLRGMLRIRPHRRNNISDCLKHSWNKKD